MYFFYELLQITQKYMTVIMISMNINMIIVTINMYIILSWFDLSPYLHRIAVASRVASIYDVQGSGWRISQKRTCIFLA